MKNRVCCLYRVSTNKQVDHNDKNQADIPMQRKACHQFAEHMDWEIVIEEQETGVSGFKVSAAERDKIQLIKDYALQDKFDILLVFMFDRIGRIASETPFVVEWFAQHGVRVWSVNEGEQRFDSHVDSLTNYIRFWQADGESRKTSVRVKTAMGQLVEAGHFKGGMAPYGYVLEKSGRINKRGKELMQLVVDEEAASVVRIIFEKYTQHGYGTQRIASYLREQGVTNAKGNNWHPCSIRGILQNLTYTGVLRCGKSRSEVMPELQIIDQETFDLAQGVASQRSNDWEGNRHIPLNTKGRSLLSGNVYCGHCGGRLTLTTSGKSYTSKKDGRKVKREKRVRYVCYNKTRKLIKCDGQTGYTMHILDDAIRTILHQIFAKLKATPESELVGAGFNTKMKELRAAIRKERTAFDKAASELKSLKSEVINALHGTSAFSVELLNELIENTQQTYNEISARLETLNIEQENSEQMLEKIKVQYKHLVNWAKTFDGADIETQKMIAAYIIKRVDVCEGYKLHMDFNIDLEQFNIIIRDIGIEPAA